MSKRAQLAAAAWALAWAMGCVPLASAGETAFGPPVPVPAAAVEKLKDVRVWPQGLITRVILDVSGAPAFKWGELHNPERLFFDLENTVPVGAKRQTFPSASRLVQQVRLALTRKATTRVVIDLEEAAEFETAQLVNPSRFVIEVRKAGTPKPTGKIESEVLVTEVRGKDGKGNDSSDARKPSRLFVPPPARKLPPQPLIPAPTMRSSTTAKVPLETLMASLVPPMGWAMPRPAPPGKKKAPVTVASTHKAPSRQMAKAEAVSAENALLRDSKLDDLPMAEPARNSETMTRALGLKLRRVVLDAGHGGKDTGTISPHGMYEKDLVLDVAQRLGKLIEDRLGSEVVYTRDDDTFIPLQDRTTIANHEKADLFLSIHANSSRAEAAYGFETYYLNFSPLKADMDVAARENASSDRTIADLNDLVKQIAMNDKLDESREFAAHVQESTHTLSVKMNGKTRNRGIKKAPFVVLIGARMPSVLVEIGFLTNTNEENQMKKMEYRQKIAEALFSGISGYADTLSHFNVASARATAASSEGN